MRSVLGFLLIVISGIALCVQQGYSRPTLQPSPQPAPSFEDVSRAAGVTNNRTPGVEMAAGQAWGDYDNDGWSDLYVTDPNSRNTLYRNQGDGTFRVSALTDQVALPRAYSQGATFVDYDNDGWRDLFVANWGVNTLFHNEAGQQFIDVTQTAGLHDDANSKTASWGDFDGDGFLDLYVANWSCYPKCGRPMEGDTDRLYRNLGDGAFADVTDYLRGGANGAGFVASFTDYDNDGDLDIYLVNDEFVNPVGNKLWRNDGPGCDGWCFTQVANEAGADQKLFGMGLAAGDYDNDGDMDYYFSNVGPMVLLQNQGDGTFRDVAAEAGVQAKQFIGWGAVFLDYDNDGWRDLYLAVADTVDHKDIAANQLFHNRGDGVFTASKCQTEATDIRMSIGVAYADYDKDGWVDMVVGNQDEGYRLYRNRGQQNQNNHWLAVELTGAGPVNRDAVGARVSVETTDGKTQMQEVINGASMGAGNELVLYFGLGEARSASINIRWPDGAQQKFTQVAADQRYTLNYPWPGKTTLRAQAAANLRTADTTTAPLPLPLPAIIALDAMALALLGLLVGRAPKRRKLGRALTGIATVFMLAGYIMAGREAGLPQRLSPNPDTRLAYLMKQADVRPPTPLPAPSNELIRLGEALFWDPELSGNRDTSCATCHQPTLGTGDNLSVSIGTGGRGLGTERLRGTSRELIPRNASPIFNLGYSEWEVLFWDGRVVKAAGDGFLTPASDRLPTGLNNVLAAQAMFPVTSRDEMRGNRGEKDIFGQPNELAMIQDYTSRIIWRDLMKRLLAIPEYVSLFQAAYPNVPASDLGFQHAANALAAYQSTAFTFEDSPFDRYLQGERPALSPEAKTGALLFYGKARCAACHSGGLLTDQQFHNLATPQLGDGKGREQPYDLGRARETGNDCDRYAYRTPPLRDVALTGPWMHNGAFTTLEATVRHHLNPSAGLRNYDANQLSGDIAGKVHAGPNVIAEVLDWYTPIATDGVQLSQDEIQALLAFLHALTAPSAVDLSHTIPASVPSGLKVGGE